MKKHITILLVSTVTLFSCSENYSNGERIGLVTQFSKTGAFWKSWEGHLNMTQTGMNSSTPFDFSIDNDNEPDGLSKTLDSAAQLGWKVKLIYHETMGKNWFHNRGSTDHFVVKCEILDKTPIQTAMGNNSHSGQGKVIDTIYVVIDKSK
jgi:hypothetical protein